MEIPKFGEELTLEQINLLETIAKSSRKSIIEMLKQAQSGHPGGSLSTIDYLTLLYSYIVSQTGDEVVVSNGHISPAVYSILAEMGYIPKQEVIDTFRKNGSNYEGHVTRHVKGISYGTGPLGVGVSAASGFALAEKKKGSDQKVYTIMGDGEAQEGQVYEMINFAEKYGLNNIILFIDYNRVQLTASLEEVMPINLRAIFESANWKVLEINGHNFSAMWKALSEAQTAEHPVAIIGETIMGKGIKLMEQDGKDFKSTWHGSPPSPEQADEALKELQLSPEELTKIEQFKKEIKWTPKSPEFIESLTPVKIDTGTPIVYTADKMTDCRSAYGAALVNLAKLNPQIMAICADLRGSVKTDGVAKETPDQHIEVGIAEQHMISMAGGLSLDGFIPFASTFGAFMTSRANDQARVNDINRTNVKMVATHCGLSVGEDGPTHQAIADKTMFLGLFNTMIIEPADPNQCDRIIRYIASHYGNFYVRMGRHKYPIITKEDGTPYYDADYQFEYGKSDLIREGTDLTIIASGATLYEAFKAINELKVSNPELSIELIANSTIKKFDETIINSIKKTGKVITVEDGNTISGLGSQLASELMKNGICPMKFEILGVNEYQLSGKSSELYEKVGISSNGIKHSCLKMIENSA